MQNKTLLEHWSEAKEIFERRKNRGKPEFPTGIGFLDEATDGLMKGEVWIIAGKAGIGKTSLALQIAREFADNPDHAVAFLSLEMKGWELVTRMFCEMKGVSYSKLKRGDYPVAYNEFDTKFRNYISKIDFEIFEFGYKFEEVEKILTTTYHKKKPDVIFVDFIQLIEWREFGDERSALMEYVRKLKELAKRLNIGVVIVSQLRRLPSGADYQREPDIIDLKGSGSLEQTADKVILVYGVEETKAGIKTVKHFINLAKNRQGEKVCKEVMFAGEHYRFEEIKEQPGGQKDYWNKRDDLS